MTPDPARRPTDIQAFILRNMRDSGQRIQSHRDGSCYVYVVEGTKWVPRTVRRSTLKTMLDAGWIKQDSDDRVAYTFYSFTVDAEAALRVVLETEGER